MLEEKALTKEYLTWKKIYRSSLYNICNWLSALGAMLFAVNVCRRIELHIWAEKRI